jgi:ADP-ribose diphosphatase
MRKILFPNEVDPNKELPEITERKELARSKHFHIEEQKLTFSNGVKTVYETLKANKRGAVLVVAVNENNKLLLIREYCGGRECYELAFPKGKLENDESIEEAANRELQEETGYQAANIRFLKSVSVAPGYMGHITHILLAENLSWAPLEGDEPESIEVYPWSLEDIPSLMQREDFTEARSITALMLAHDYLKSKK